MYIAAIFITLGAGSQAYAEGALVAQARLMDATGKRIGIVSLVEHNKGVQITLNARGLTPGEHGLHIHKTGHCVTPNFVSASYHFNPYGTQHGMENPIGPHGGDLPNLVVKDNGNVATTMENDLVTLEEGFINSLFDADGSAIVIHAKPDDGVTNPTGNSGARVACGVIEKLN